MAVISILEFKLWIILIITIVSADSILLPSGSEPTFHIEKEFEELQANDYYMKNDSEPLKIFCYNGISKTVLQIWRSVHLSLVNVPRSYKIYTGVNVSEVKQMYGGESMWLPSWWIMGQQTSVDLPAFAPYCIGISTREQYVVHLKVKAVNYWRLLQTCICIFLFLCAPSLSRNPLFHYMSAVSLGVMGSLLVLIYILSRFIPKKPSSYAILVFGYSLILYVLQRVWHQFNEIIANYMDFLVAYCICAAVVSFFVCYRWGPVKNVRTINVIQWSMQIVAMIFIYLSSEYREVSTVIILLVTAFYLFSSSLIARAKGIRYRFFPPKVRLLTEIEYTEQGIVETEKALHELRNFCTSPKCDTWRTVTRLKDAQKFATFIETGMHCSNEESSLHSAHGFEENSDDDEVESDTELNDDSYSPNIRNGYHSYR